MTEPMEGHPPPGRTAYCPHCGAGYDCERVAFCDCLSHTPTPLCSACGKCLCRLPQERQQVFWQSAPQELFRRKVEGRLEARDAPAPTADLRRPLVLVAEDDVVTRRIAQRALGKMGYGVVTAVRGDEALELARRILPDAVLTDALMPKLDGRKLCLALKQDASTERIRVIVMTSLFKKGQSKSEALREFRADAFLTKPIDFPRLQQVMRELIGLPEGRPGAAP